MGKGVFSKAWGQDPCAERAALGLCAVGDYIRFLILWKEGDIRVPGNCLYDFWRPAMDKTAFFLINHWDNSKLMEMHVLLDCDLYQSTFWVFPLPLFSSSQKCLRNVTHLPPGGGLGLLAWGLPPACLLIPQHPWENCVATLGWYLGILSLFPFHSEIPSPLFHCCTLLHLWFSLKTDSALGTLR